MKWGIGCSVALLCLSAPACADEARGALLYEAHCNACHGTEIHWRSKRLATDWASLLREVRRWQAGLNWSEPEIADVAGYLNARYYGFPEPGRYSQVPR